MNFQVTMRGMAVLITLGVSVLAWCEQPHRSLLEQIVVLEANRVTPDDTFEGVGRRYDALLAEHVDPVERGIISASKLRRYSSYGERRLEVVIEYAHDALAYPLEPDVAMNVWLRLGDALWRKGCRDTEKDEVTARREAAVAYLQGIRVAIEHGAPYDPPPKPERPFSAGPLNPETQALDEEAKRRMAGFRILKRSDRVINIRIDLERALLYLYALTPRDNEELNSLCDEYLEDEAYMARILEKLPVAIEEVAGESITSAPVLFPFGARDVQGTPGGRETGNEVQGSLSEAARRVSAR